VFCDETADCPRGQRCCLSFDNHEEGKPWGYECSMNPCTATERCMPGGACSHGYQCNADALEGTCKRVNPGTACGKAKCPAATPVCCWDAGTKTGACVADECRTLQETRLTCASPSDCEGQVCGTTEFIGDPDKDKHPGFLCNPASHLTFRMLCSTLQDCPRHPRSGEPRRACRHTAELPAGVKECVYE